MAHFVVGGGSPANGTSEGEIAVEEEEELEMRGIGRYDVDYGERKRSRKNGMP